MEWNMELLADLWQWVIQHLPRIFTVILFLWLGLKLINWIERLLIVFFERRKVKKGYPIQMKNMVGFCLKAVVIITAIYSLGFNSNIRIFIIGAILIVLVLAFYRNVYQFAGGLFIIFNQPFRVGDLIEINGHMGHVEEIGIFNTRMESPEGKKVILPNGDLANKTITNYSLSGKIRVDLLVGISYHSDLQLTKKIIMEIMNLNKRILQYPVPLVGVKELNESRIDLTIQAFCRPADYWEVYFELFESIKQRLEECGIQIPFPQLDVNFESGKLKKLMI